MVFVVGCAGGDSSIDRTFDPCDVQLVGDMSEAQRVAVDEAFALWGIARGATAIEVRFEDAAAAFHGHYDDENAIVFINRAITEPRALSIVIAHELGHAFGLLHVDERSVMQRGNLSVAPTDEDRAITSSCAPPRS